LLVLSSVVSRSILIHTSLLTSPANSLLLVTKVLTLMMLVCSTAHTFLFRWFVLLVRTPSSPRLASRPDMVWLLTHLQMVLIRIWVPSRLVLTDTTEELLLRTSCEFISHIFRDLQKRSFFLCPK